MIAANITGATLSNIGSLYLLLEIVYFTHIEAHQSMTTVTENKK